MNSIFVLVVEIWGLIEISSTRSMLLSNKNPCKDVIHIGANAERYTTEAKNSGLAFMS